jgi:hypothetical protein
MKSNVAAGTSTPEITTAQGNLLLIIEGCRACSCLAVMFMSCSHVFYVLLQPQAVNQRHTLRQPRTMNVESLRRRTLRLHLMCCRMSNYRRMFYIRLVRTTVKTNIDCGSIDSSGLWAIGCIHFFQNVLSFTLASFSILLAIVAHTAADTTTSSTTTGAATAPATTTSTWKFDDVIAVCLLRSN